MNPAFNADKHQQHGDFAPTGITSSAATVRWLVARLTNNIHEDDDDADPDGHKPEPSSNQSTSSSLNSNERGVPVGDAGIVLNATTPLPADPHGPDPPTSKFLQSTSRSPSTGSPQSELPQGPLSPASPASPSANSVTGECTGLSGRTNKIADTCYAFWVGASLEVSSFTRSNGEACAPYADHCHRAATKMLSSLHLIDALPVRRYLLARTQHLVGGFGKLPGDPPDAYHAYLGLAALSLLDGATARAKTRADPGGQPPVTTNGGASTPPAAAVETGKGRASVEASAQGLGLAPLDPALCISIRAREWLEGLSWRRGEAETLTV